MSSPVVSATKKRMRKLKAIRTNALLQGNDKAFKKAERELEKCRAILGTKNRRKKMIEAARTEEVQFLASIDYEMLHRASRGFTQPDGAAAFYLGISMARYRTIKKKLLGDEMMDTATVEKTTANDTLESFLREKAEREEHVKFLEETVRKLTDHIVKSDAEKEKMQEELTALRNQSASASQNDISAEFETLKSIVQPLLAHFTTSLEKG